jgi:hypothetical protein
MSALSGIFAIRRRSSVPRGIALGINIYHVGDISQRLFIGGERAADCVVGWHNADNKVILFISALAK